jgi:hypothetical protein
MSAYQPSLRRRARLLAGCAVALGLSVQAQAQNAFQADVTGNPLGSANVTRGQTVGGRLTDIVTVNTKQAVIDWSATAAPSMDGSVNVLPTNNQLLFSADGNNVGNYTVLNRVATAAAGDPAIRFDGLVKSQLDFGYGATQPGGNILFYSPGGIIAGATSQFDVGSLVLSAADILFDPDGGIFGSDVEAQTGTLRFRPEFGDNRSMVTVEQGASLRARDNYVALVAPRIAQGGVVEAKGSVAYVAAQAADITIPMAGGLFDIGIVEGSSVSPGGETTLTHTGTTTGPADDGSIANRRIYMVALPKNDAVTMLVSGNVGYTQAVSMEVADGQIILAAASNVSSSDSVSGLASGSAVQITGGSFSSNLKAVADQIAVTASAGDLSAAGDVDLRSNSGNILLAALGGNDVTIAGNTLLRLDNGRQGSAINVTANAGSTVALTDLTVETENSTFFGSLVTGVGIGLSAAGGIITAADISLSSLAQGGSGGAATGGTIDLLANGGGQIQASSILAVSNGSGGDAGYGGAGAGTGGTVTMTAGGGGLIQAGDIELLAKGLGGDGAAGGKADGGIVVLNATGATVTSSNLNLDASAIGGQSFGSGASGSAVGGIVTVTSGTGGQITGSGTFRANGTGGRGFSSSKAGDGTGGTVNVQLTGGNLDVTGGTARIFADGIGGNNFSGGGASTARGGTVSVTVGSESSQLAFGTLLVGADGRYDEFVDGPTPPNHGGAGVGGTVAFSVAAGAVQGGELEVTATGSGAGSRVGGVGGSGFQGRAALTLSGGTVNIDTLSVLAEAYGGQGNDQGDSGYGIAAGSGGSAGVGPSLFSGEAGAILTATGGTLTVSNIDVSGDSSGGFGGDGREFNSEPLAGDGGAATGGSASFASSGSASLSIGSLRVRANANAESDGEESFRGGSGGSVRLGDSSSSDGLGGAGGAAVGGLATITIGGSGSLLINDITARASGFGGEAGLVADILERPISGNGLGGNGGSGTGGTADILINTGLSGSPSMSAAANGIGADGGRGPNSGNAGDGLGGSATVAITGGTTSFNQIHVSGIGFGGNGADGNTGAGGAGGKGQGLNAALTIGSGASVMTQELTLYADGEGGRGGTGSADAVGFDGGAGGEGKGGNAALTLTGGSITLFGGEGGSTAIFSANGSGGYGGSGGGGEEGGGGNAGNGGNATGGTVSVLSTNGSLDFFATEITVNANAGGRGFGGIGAVNGLDGEQGIAAAGTISIDAQHGGSATARLNFGRGFLEASSRIDESINGRAGHVFVDATGGGTGGAIRFETLDTSSDGAAAAADSLPAIRLTGAGLVRVDSNADLQAVGDIALADRLSVGASLNVASNSDIRLISGADVAVQQNILLRSGDDIIIGSGALLRGTSGAVPEAGYGGPRLDIQAGSLGRRGGIVFDDISSFILEGDIDAADRTAIVQADAVVARTSTQFSAGNLYVLLHDVPSGEETPKEDLGQLRPLRALPCLQGDVCLGNVSVSGFLEIGNSFFGFDIPNNVRLNGGVDAQRVTLIGQNVRLGQADQTQFIKASESLQIASLGSSLFLDGTLSIQGGSEETRIASAFNINGAKADITAPGTLQLTASNNVTLGAIDAQSIQTVDFEGSVLEESGIAVNGSIDVGAIATGSDLNLSAGTGVTLGQASLSPFSSLSMTTSAGLASLGGGNVGSALVRGETVSVSVTATGSVSATATNGDAVLGTISANSIDAFAAGNILAGGTLDAVAIETGYGVDGGTIDLYALGDVDVGDGAQLIADQDLAIRAGDDILVGAGATLRAARNAPASSASPLFQPGQLSLEAGVINVAAGEPEGSTNIHSIRLETGSTLIGRTVVLTGEAIQGTSGSSIQADNLFARIVAAPPLDGTPLDDGGALLPACTQGNLCLGNLDVTEQLRIGEDEFVANRVTIAGTIGADDVLLRSRNTLTLSQGLTAGKIQIESVSRDVVLGSGVIVTATNGPLSIVAGRDLIGAGASVSGGAVGISVGRDVSLGTLSAVTIRGADADGIAPSQRGFQNARNVTISGTLAVSGAPIEIDVTGAIDIGTISSSGLVKLSGAEIAIGSIAAPSAELLSTGNIIVTGVLTASDTLKLKAGGDLIGAGATFSAKNSVDIAAGGQALGLAIFGGFVTVDAANGISFNSIRGNPSIALNAANGAISIQGDISASEVTATGRSIALVGSERLTVNKAVATAGDVSLVAQSGDLVAGEVSASGAVALTSPGALTFASVSAGGAATVNAQQDVNGGDLTAASLKLSTPGRLTGETFAATAGDMSLKADAGIFLSSAGGTGSVSLTASSGLIQAGIGNSGTGVTAVGRSVSLGSNSGLKVLSATATAGNVNLSALTGDLQVDQASGQRMTLSAERNLQFGTTVAGDTLTIKAGGNVTGGEATASQVSATAGGAIAADRLVAELGNVTLTAANGITLDSFKALGTANLDAGAGTLLVKSDAQAKNVTATGASVSLTAVNDLILTQGTATDGDLTVMSEQGHVQLGQASATASLNAIADSITVSGAATATNITFTSKDLTIGATGQIGSKDTAKISLTSTADRLFLGDAAGSGYRIDGAEFGRLVSGGDIAIVSAPQNIVGVNFDLLDPAGTNIVAGSFDFDGGQLGTNGTLTFDSERSIGFTGNVQFKNFVNSQTVVFDAGTDISLAAETGLVTIKNSNGGLAGTMVLTAQQVHAMSTKARSEIAGLQLNEVRQRLGTNDQLENDGGYFQANRIIVNIGRLAFIQNSGANGTNPDAKRGITANELIINAGEGSPVQLVVNGREGSATGEALRSNVAVNGSIDQQSSFNGCVSGTACIPAVEPPPPVDPIDPRLEIIENSDPLASARDQVQDDEEEDEKEEALQASQTRPDPVIQMVPAPSSRFDPLIDEPVTGAGNEDLWEPTTPSP